jgi:hypothetical protein
MGDYRLSRFENFYGTVQSPHLCADSLLDARRIVAAEKVPQSDYLYSWDPRESRYEPQPPLIPPSDQPQPQSSKAAGREQIGAPGLPTRIAKLRVTE